MGDATFQCRAHGFTADIVWSPDDGGWYWSAWDDEGTTSGDVFSSRSAVIDDFSRWAEEARLAIRAAR